MTTINAQALICDDQQRFSIQDVLLDDPAPDQIAIKTHYSGVSIGTEFALIRNKISWGPYPICTGYMGTGIVEKVGSAIDNFKVGDAVYYRHNDNMRLPNGQKISTVQGGHSSHVVVRPNGTHGAYPLVPGAPMDVASMFVTPAVGLNGVDMANPRMGDVIVVYGVGLIGLGVVAACAMRGCVVVAVDVNEKQLGIARELGADHMINSARQNVPDALKTIAPDGADVIFESTGLPQCLDPAIALCRTHGKFVWQGNYGAAPVAIHFLPPHGKRLQMFFPCDDGLQACRRAVLKNIASGALKWEKTITHRVNHQDAPQLFAEINAGQNKDIVGVVIGW